MDGTPGPQKPHHTAGGFRNNYLDRPIGGSFWKWQWDRLRQGLPKRPANGYRFPSVAPDAGWLRANRSVPAATWIGHATMLMQTAGVNLLTDPVFSERASPVQWAGPKRRMPPALTLAELPHIDIVLISHNHYDHLDRTSVRALAAQPGGPPLFLVPLGIRDWMAGAGIRHVRECDWWDEVDACGLQLTFVPAQHWSARGLRDRCKTLWGGWAVHGGAAPSPSFLFAGDTGYSPDFVDIGRHFGGFDLALLPIGAYAPRWFMRAQHVDPEESVQIHRDVGARRSIAIHWGTFELTDEPLDEPPERLRAAVAAAGLPADSFLVLKHGETIRDFGSP